MLLLFGLVLLMVVGLCAGSARPARREIVVQRVVRMTQADADRLKAAGFDVRPLRR